MKPSIVFVICPLLTVLPTPASAADNDFEAWATGTASGSLSGKVIGTLEIAARQSDDPVRGLTTLIRPSIGYQITPKLSISMGYARFTVRPDSRPAIEENRIFQQASWSIGKVMGGTVTSRTRLEQRMFEGRRDTGWRGRQLMRWVAPISTKGLNAVIASEIFVAFNATDFGARKGFDQWRNFVGVNIPLSKGLAIEAGYLNRYVRRVGVPDRIDHILPVTAAWRF